MIDAVGGPGGGDAQSPHPAVVVGLDTITGLQTARILAGHGIPVTGLANDAGHYACRTRACERVVQADLLGEGFVAALERLGPPVALDYLPVSWRQEADLRTAVVTGARGGTDALRG